MIDVMDVRCPHCKNGFSVDMYFGEETLTPEACLTRKAKQHISWGEIAEEIGRGNGGAVLDVGDTISFKLKDGKEVTVAVVARNLYNPREVIFMFDDIYWRSSMNSRDTNRGGWAESKVADYIQNEILPLLPNELLEVIKPRKITQKLSGVEYTKESKLWLPSKTELFGENERYTECDFGDKHFPLFKTERSRVKCAENGETDWYWLRSPYIDYSSTFCSVYYGGYSGYYYASSTYGVCPCFSI